MSVVGGQKDMPPSCVLFILAGTLSTVVNCWCGGALPPGRSRPPSLCHDTCTHGGRRGEGQAGTRATAPHNGARIVSCLCEGRPGGGTGTESIIGAAPAAPLAKLWRMEGEWRVPRVERMQNTHGPFVSDTDQVRVQGRGKRWQPLGLAWWLLCQRGRGPPPVSSLVQSSDRTKEASFSRKALGGGESRPDAIPSCPDAPTSPTTHISPHTGGPGEARAAAAPADQGRARTCESAVDSACRGGWERRRRRRSVGVPTYSSSTY